VDTCDEGKSTVSMVPCGASGGEEFCGMRRRDGRWDTTVNPQWSVVEAWWPYSIIS